MSIKTPPEHTDLRVRRTHKLLWEALMAELAERPFAEITVTDICDRAMVHRTTFYKHYDDKYALLEQGMRRMIDALMADEEHLPPSAFSADHPPPYFVRLYEQAAHHRQFYKLMVCGEGNAQFQRLVKEYIARVAADHPRASPTAKPHLAVAAEMHAHYVAGATLSLLAWWLDHDMPFSPLRMAQYLMSPHDTASSSR